MKNKKLKEYRFWVIMIISDIIFLFLAIYIPIKISQHNHNDILENPPTIEYIEEDAEFYLMSTMLEVIDVDDEGDYIIYTIYDADTENYYKVSYKIERSNNIVFVVYKWVYNSHIYIGKEYEEEK